MFEFRVAATLWRYEGEAAWYFVTLPHDVADEIEELTASTRRGFGSVRVHVSAAASDWSTSLFPSTQAESYVLPVKKAIRRAEGWDDGDRVELRIVLADD